MADPRVVFGAAPGGWFSSSGGHGEPFSEVNPEMLNDFVGGFVQNMFGPATARPYETRGAGFCPFGSTEGCRGRKGGRPEWFSAGPAHMMFGACGPFGQDEGSAQHGNFAWFCPQACPNKSRPTESKEKSTDSQPRCQNGKQDKPKPESDGKDKERKSTREAEDPVAECLKKCQEHFGKILRNFHSHWTTVVRLEGFGPEEIKVKVDDVERVARIHALHESGDGENQFDRRETRRVVKLPEDVIPESVKVTYRPGGALVIVGERRQEEDEDEGEREMDVEFEGADAASKKCTSTRCEDSLSAEKEPNMKQGGRSTPEGTTSDDPTPETEQVTMEIQDAPTEAKPSEVASDNVGEAKVTFSSDDESDDVGKTFVLLPQNGKDGPKDESFSVELDVSKFSPENVSIRVSGGLLTVTAEEEEEKDGFYTQHKLQRSYKLPGNVDAESLKSTINSDGILKVLAPENSDHEVAQEKTLAIELQ